MKYTVEQLEEMLAEAKRANNTELAIILDTREWQKIADLYHDIFCPQYEVTETVNVSDIDLCFGYFPRIVNGKIKVESFDVEIPFSKHQNKRLTKIVQELANKKLKKEFEQLKVLIAKFAKIHKISQKKLWQELS